MANHSTDTLDATLVGANKARGPDQHRLKLAPMQTKRAELIALVSKPNGAKLSTLSKRLGWQPHSVRGAICELKKSGLDVVRHTSNKDGQTVYCLRSMRSSGEDDA